MATTSFPASVEPLDVTKPAVPQPELEYDPSPKEDDDWGVFSKKSVKKVKKGKAV